MRKKPESFYKEVDDDYQPKKRKKAKTSGGGGGSKKAATGSSSKKKATKAATTYVAAPRQKTAEEIAEEERKAEFQRLLALESSKSKPPLRAPGWVCLTPRVTLAGLFESEDHGDMSDCADLATAYSFIWKFREKSAVDSALQSWLHC